MPGENQVLARGAGLVILIAILAACSANPDKPDISVVYELYYSAPAHFGGNFLHFQHSFLNIVLFVLLFTAFQMWRNRRRDYLFYTLYLALTWVYFARVFPPYFYYLFSELEQYLRFHDKLRAPGEINAQTEFIFFHFLSAGYYLFVRVFFDLSRRDPQLDMVIRWFIRLLLGIGTLLVVLLVVTGVYQSSGPLMIWLKNAWLIPSFWVLWRIWKAGFPGGGYIIAGSLALVSSSIVVGILHLSGDPIVGKRVYIQLGVLMEILLFSAALGQKDYRFQLSRRLAEEQAALAEERAQLALEKSEQLRLLDAAKTRLFTNITHEFRTPLTVILGMADKVEEAPRQWLRPGIQAIRLHGHSLLRLVNQMLDLARLESGTLPLHLIQGDINVHLNNLVEHYRSYADSKNIRMQFVTEPEQIVMDYDPNKIGDIVSNLLSNALKFTPVGGEVRLWAGLLKLGGVVNLELRVSDTGPGIAPEKLPHIFERFYQADDSATRRGEGTGIGLALTKELVKLLGGSIEARSEPGKGAAFMVQLPIRNTAPRQEAPQLPKQTSLRPDTPDFPRTKIKSKLPLALIVEDNASIAALLAAGLEGQYRIETASNGRAGVERAIELVPDVIISDVMMPEMDGFELCHTLKGDLRTSHIPIVLLTARADMDSRLEGLEMGADAYLAKPFDQRELEVSLRKSMELRRRLRQRYASGSVPAGPAPAIFNKNDEFVRQLQALLQAHYSDPKFSAKDIEKGLFMSSTQLRRKMKTVLNATPQKYLRSYRLKQAIPLLETTDQNILAIAIATGFSDQANFTHAFTKEFGMPPGAWRGG